MPESKIVCGRVKKQKCDNIRMRVRFVGGLSAPSAAIDCNSIQLNYFPVKCKLT